MISNKRIMAGGLLVAFFTTLLDQWHKWWMLERLDIASQPPIAVTDFFNLVMVWNHGISFGMFSEHNQPLPLIIMAVAIIIVLLCWLAKSTDRLSLWGIGLVIGGAAGNIIDRARLGAVADFFDFHVFGYHWPAFNIADSAIFMGVVVLCIQSIMQPRKS